MTLPRADWADCLLRITLDAKHTPKLEERLPTIITTSDRLSDIDAARPRIASRLLDKMVVTVLPLQGPDYRRHSVPGG